MASITKRYRTSKGEKVFDSWGIRTSKITGKEIAFHAPATRYNESDVTKRREIIEAVEKAFSRGKGATSETLEEIQELNDPYFLEWLTKYGIVAPVKVLSFEGLLEMVLKGLAERGTKRQTLRLIKRGASYFSEYLEEQGQSIPVAAIDKKLARNFWTWFKAKSADNDWTPVTINNYLTYIKQVFKWGVKHLDEMTGNPFEGIDKIVDTREKPKKYLSEEQAQDVLNALERSDNPQLWTAFFLLGYRQGLRVWSEAPRLRWGFVDFEGRRLMIDDVKRSKLGAKKTREMILDNQTADALRRLRDYRQANGETTREQDYIFPEFWKTPGAVCYCSTVILTKFQRIVRRLGIDFACNVGTMRRAASNYWGELVGEYNENMFLGHSKEVARAHYRTESVTQNALDMYDSRRNAVESH